MAELLAIDGVTAGYGDGIVLEDVSLALDDGDSLALLGRNGMGKTTLLVTLMGLTRVRAARCAGAVRTWRRCPPGAAAGRDWAGFRRNGTCGPRSPSRST